MSAKDEVRAAALALLARRDYSRAELGRKLSARGHDPEVVEGVLEALVAEGWLKEERRAESLLRRGLERGYGPRRLEAMLLACGFPPQQAREYLQALAGAGIDWLKLARATLSGLRPRAGESHRDFRRRLARHLERRGFSADVIARIVPVAEDSDEV